MTVCMGYPAMTPQVGKPENAAGRGQENHVGENGTPNVNWSKWPVDVVNDTKRHSLEELSALRLTSCGHFDYMRQIGRSLNQFSYAVEWGLIHIVSLLISYIVIVCGLWQGASYSGAHPVFCFALNLLAHGFQPHSSNISPGHHSESNPHSLAGHCR